MNEFVSPGSLVTIAGAVLTVIGSIAYAGDNANLSLPTIFYGIPILLGGLALKSSELAPPQRLTPPGALKSLREQPSNDALRKLLADVTRWRYGQKAHLESSLEALKLWNDENPPQLVAVRELDLPEGYGLSLQFDANGVPWQRWQDQQQRLGRFFGPGLRADVQQPAPGRIDVTLLPEALPLPASPLP